MGKKKPYMWWEQCEIDLNFAFEAYVQNIDHQVYSERMKLRTLTKKVNSDFLARQKATIKSAMAASPMIMTYNHAMTFFLECSELKVST